MGDFNSEPLDLCCTAGWPAQSLFAGCKRAALPFLLCCCKPIGAAAAQLKQSCSSAGKRAAELLCKSSVHAVSVKRLSEICTWDLHVHLLPPEPPFLSLSITGCCCSARIELPVLYLPWSAPGALQLRGAADKRALINGAFRWPDVGSAQRWSHWCIFSSQAQGGCFPDSQLGVAWG